MSEDIERSGYRGPERRERIRREADCAACSGIQTSIMDIKEKNKITCGNVSELKRELDGKISMKLFYVILALIVSILGFQWSTYEKVGAIALHHEERSHKLTVEISDLGHKVDSHQKLSNMELNIIRNKVDDIQRELRDHSTVDGR
jgi:hypothetical protein